MKNLLILFLLAFPFFAGAQKTHTVGPKESLFSIGRLYSVHPRELAEYNHISFEGGLTIGQVLKIPGKPSMAPVGEAAPAPPAPPAKTEAAKPAVVKTEKKAAGSAPVYHTVAPKEGLYGISKHYNITIEQIKQWNQLQGDALDIGQQLIVGYNGNSAPVASTPEPAKPAPVAKVQPEPQAKAEPIAPVVTSTATAPKAEPVKTVTDAKGGFFKNLYNEAEGGKNGHTRTGTAGVFKSTSGWEDGKYYCLHNTAPAGTIVKITNTLTQKSVYAKVLDLIPDIRQNETVVIRVSNAASGALGGSMEDVSCVVEW